MSLILPTRQALAAARFYAIEKAPYFAQALLALQPHEVEDGTLSPTGTFGVTAKGVLLYEPAALRRWSTPEAGSVLIHEVLHWIRDHAGRREAMLAEPKLWNAAGDLEINDDLKAMSLPLPDNGGLQPSKEGFPEGKTAEEYYALLQQQQDQKAQKSGGVYQPPPPGFGGGCPCGSAAGHKLDAEPEEQGGGSAEEDEDGSSAPPGHDSDFVEAVRQATAAAVSDAAAKGIGNVPAGLRRWADERLQPPKVPWSTKLARAGRGAAAYRPGAVDYAFTRVSRRQGGLGFGSGRPVAPALVSRTPNVAVAVDTSGSMGESELTRAVTEAEAVMKAIGATIQFLACDCKVHVVDRVRTPAQLASSLKGGGGTSFLPVFETLRELTPKPDVLIFITDGRGEAPVHAPKGTAVIWLLVGKHRCRPFTKRGAVAWGEVIEVDD